MAGENRLFEDFSKLAGGAFSALSGVREEVEARMREQMERMFARLDMVKREEFEVVQAMAAKARAEQEALSIRVAALEAALAAVSPESGAKPARRSPRRPISGEESATPPQTPDDGT